MSTNKLINFHVRLKLDKSLSEIATYLEQRLQLHFVPSQEKFDIENGGAMLTEVMGFHITLAFNFKEGDPRRVCQLVGVIDYELMGEHWDERIDLSEFMVKYLHTKGIEGWYEPDIDEFNKQCY